MKQETAKKLTRDCLSMFGLACIGVAVWLCPPIGLLAVGGAMVAGAVVWQKSEWRKTQGEMEPRRVRRV